METKSGKDPRWGGEEGKKRANHSRDPLLMPESLLDGDQVARHPHSHLPPTLSRCSPRAPRGRALSPAAAPYPQGVGMAPLGQPRNALPLPQPAGGHSQAYPPLVQWKVIKKPPVRMGFTPYTGCLLWVWMRHLFWGEGGVCRGAGDDLY